MSRFVAREQIFCNDEFRHLYVWNYPPYETPFTGITVSWYPTGRLKVEREYTDGADVGYKYVWYPSGQIKEDVQPVTGYNWVVRYWHENGQLERYFIRRGWEWKELELKRWNELGVVVEHRVWPGHVAEIPDDTSTLSAVPVAKSLGIPRHLIEQPYGHTVPD